jgi:hypothetical protein
MEAEGMARDLEREMMREEVRSLFDYKLKPREVHMLWVRYGDNEPEWWGATFAGRAGYIPKEEWVAACLRIKAGWRLGGEHEETERYVAEAFLSRVDGAELEAEGELGEQ